MLGGEGTYPVGPRVRARPGTGTCPPSITQLLEDPQELELRGDAHMFLGPSDAPEGAVLRGWGGPSTGSHSLGQMSPE